MVSVSPSKENNNKALKRAEEAFSQGKWMDSSTILKKALEDLDKVDIDVDDVEALSDGHKKTIKVEGVLRNKLGHSIRRMGRFEEAQVEFERGKRIGELLGDDRVLADALLGMGFFEWGRGEYNTAKQIFWECIERADRVGDIEIKGRAYMGLGNIALVTRRLEEGAQAYKKSLDYLEKIEGTEIERARVLHNQAFIYFKGDKMDEAEAAFKKCISFCEEQGDLSTSGFALSNLAHIYVNTDRLREADTVLEKAGRNIARTNDRFGLNLIRWVRGLLKFKKGDLKGAVQSYKKARKEYEEMKAPGQLLHLTIDYIPVLLEAGQKEGVIHIINDIKRDLEKKGLERLLDRLKKAEQELLDQ